MFKGPRQIKFKGPMGPSSKGPVPPLPSEVHIYTASVVTGYHGLGSREESRCKTPVCPQNRPFLRLKSPPFCHPKTPLFTPKNTPFYPSKSPFLYPKTPPFTPPLYKPNLPNTLNSCTPRSRPPPLPSRKSIEDSDAALTDGLRWVHLPGRGFRSSGFTFCLESTRRKIVRDANKGLNPP